MAAERPGGIETRDSVAITNPDGGGCWVLTCDHASNFVPAEFGALGLPQADLSRHIAWDPGALPVARLLAETLDATLVETCVSRLVLDCNRALDAPDLIPQVSEDTAIPGNAGLSDAQRQARIARCWRPFHDAVDAVVGERLAAGREVRLASVHSFTPVYRGAARPWHVGIIHDGDERLSRPLLAALARTPGIVVGDNEPYSPADRVYYTLERHARPRGLPCVMIEIRNDEIATGSAQKLWAERLATCLNGIGVAAASGFGE